MPKFPSKVKVINIKEKIIILRVWKGHFSTWKGHFCIVCRKVEGPRPLWPPSSYVPEMVGVMLDIQGSMLINILSFCVLEDQWGCCIC